MKTNNIKDIAFTTIMVLTTMMMHSCQLGTKGRIDAEEQALQFVLEKHLDTLHMKNTENEMLTVDYEFQFLKPGGTINDSVNAGIDQVFLSGTRNTDIAAAMAEALIKEEEEMKEMALESYDPDDETYGGMGYYAVHKGRFLDNAQDTVLAYEGVSDVYMGGAHGSYIPFFLNFSKITGQIIHIDNLLDTTKETEILDTVLEKLLKDKGCTTREELMEKTSVLAFGDLFITPNFHMGKDSITFCYGQYEIGPYSSGITYITLDYKALKPYMRK